MQHILIGGEIWGHNTFFISYRDFIVVSRCHFEGARRLRNLSGFPIGVGNDDEVRDTGLRRYDWEGWILETGSPSARG
jgi:hypothetical protein